MVLEDTIKVQKFFENSFDKSDIAAHRKQLLTQIAHKISDILVHTNTPLYLNFIGTHNASISQFAQIWSYYAAHYFRLQRIKSNSGGISETSLNRNTIKTLQEAGFNFSIVEFNHLNPKYAIQFEGNTSVLTAYAKCYREHIAHKPSIAITTCTQVNDTYMLTPNAIWKFHLPYTNPLNVELFKKNKKAYQRINRQIAAEMYYLYATINSNDY